MSATVAIKVQNVEFTYPDGHEVLKGLDCEIRAGEKVALIGPNGAGKSTFMSLLNGVSLPTWGQVFISGMEVKKENLTTIRRKVGVVFQDPDDQLFCPSVFDDVAFGPLNLGMPQDEIRMRVSEALETVGLSGFEERSSFHLSFGERKRLALATVLSYQPEILVFDEPSTNMDPLNRRNLIKWLQQANRTMLLCTHDLDIALDVCDRCLVLNGGSFVADGSASEILYDRTLLEQNNLELPLALMTHELLHHKLRTGDMDDEHRRIIEKFLHAHHHVHGPDGHAHVHIHFHPHEHEHLHDEVPDVHIHAFPTSHEHGDHAHDHDLREPHDHTHDGHGLAQNHSHPHHDEHGHGHMHTDPGHSHADRAHTHGHDHTHDHTLSHGDQGTAGHTHDHSLPHDHADPASGQGQAGGGTSRQN